MLIVIWSLFGVVFFVVQANKLIGLDLPQTQEQQTWILERDDYTCQFSKWDIPSRSFLICGDFGARVILIGRFRIRPSNHICVCEKHENQISEASHVTLETHLIKSAKERGKAFAKTKIYPFN